MSPLTPLDWSEEILEEIFRNASVGFVLLDLHGTIIEVNEAFAEMLGRERSAIVGHAMRDLVLADDAELTEALGSKLCRGEIGNFEMRRRYRLLDGRVLTAKVSASIVRSSRDGDPVCAMELIEDVAARVEAEQGLRDSEQRYRAMVENQTEFIVRWLPNGTRVFVNDAFCRYLDLPRERILGTSVFSLIPSDDRAVLRQTIARLTPQHRTATTEYRVVLPRGETRWTEWTDSATFTGGGELVELQSVGRDVTDQRDAENALVRSESRFRRVFEDLPIAAWEVDWSEIVAFIRANGITSLEDFLALGDAAATTFDEFLQRTKMLAVNQVGLDLAGVASLEEFALWNRNAYPPEAVPVVAHAVKGMVFGTEKTAEAEIPLLRADGTRIEVLIRWARSWSEEEPWRFVVTVQDQTQRKQAENALSVSESKFRRFFRDLPIPAWMSDWSAALEAAPVAGIEWREQMRHTFDAETAPGLGFLSKVRLVDVNPHGLALIGARSLAEFEEWYPRMYATESMREIAEAAATVLLGGAERNSAEVKVLTRRGESRDVLLQFARSDERSDRGTIVVTAVDVTERKRAEQALRRSEEKFKRLFMDLPIAVWLVDWTPLVEEIRTRSLTADDLLALASEADVSALRDLAARTSILEVNSVALRLAGARDPEDFRRVFPSGIARDGWRRLVRAASQLLFEGRAATSCEITMIRNDGTEADVLTRWSRAEPNESSWKFIATALDVTERNRIERDLESQRHLLEQAEAIARLGSWEWNARTGVVRGSAEFNKILGHPAAETWSFDELMDLIHEEDLNIVRHYLDSTPGGAIGQPIEYRIRDRRGEEKYVRLQGYLGRGAAGAPTGGFGILQDVTAQKRAEQIAGRQRDELARADKMISLGILVSGVAHEINNPNHFIMLSAPLLRQVWQDALPALEAWEREHAPFHLGGLEFAEVRAEVPQVIDEIIAGSERIRAIVTELKDYARDPEPGMRDGIDLNDVVATALRLIANRVRTATRRFEVAYGRPLPTIHGNAQKLEQVIINLVLNSCQALETTQGRIRVETGTGPDRNVFVRVEDEGKGIAESDLPRIVDPFFTTKRTAGGTGLGLAVAARIVQEHAGRLTFESTPGRGTTALLLLPVPGASSGDGQ